MSFTSVLFVRVRVRVRVFFHLIPTSRRRRRLPDNRHTLPTLPRRKAPSHSFTR